MYKRSNIIIDQVACRRIKGRQVLCNAKIIGISVITKLIINVIYRMHQSVPRAVPRHDEDFPHDDGGVQGGPQRPVETRLGRPQQLPRPREHGPLLC